MNIVFLTHPAFLGSQSMPRFTKFLANGMTKRGHTVQIWIPEPYFYKIPITSFLKKWLGYIDQFVLFPLVVSNRLRKADPETLFVFTDHALGPWVSLLAQKPHVIHCHDFLAQNSAREKNIENLTGWTGRQYQAFIRRGFSRGKNFISVSEKTRSDLHKILPFRPSISEVVYNGLTKSFIPQDIYEVRNILSHKKNIELSSGYLLHVGGNLWYKNRTGVIEIYNAWRLQYGNKLPLLLVGEAPDNDLLQAKEVSIYGDSIHFLTGLNDESVRLCYAGASVFLFPSLAEGFGWPIAEAMASGCPVITTNEAPMTEVGGTAAFYISRRPSAKPGILNWAVEAAKVVEQILTLSVKERVTVVESGLLNAKRFNPENALDKIESIYQDILFPNKIHEITSHSGRNKS